MFTSILCATEKMVSKNLYAGHIKDHHSVYQKRKEKKNDVKVGFLWMH